MNNRRNVRVLFTCAAVAVAAGLVPLSPASGQQGIECPGGYEPFDLEFRGGTVADYTRAILAVNPCANVLVTTDAEAMSVPAVVLRSVNVEMALRLIAEGQPRRDGEFEEFLVVRVFNLPDLEQQGFRIERVQRLVQPRNAGAMSEPAADADSREVNVWGLSSIFALGVSADRAIGAVEVALAMVGKDAEVRFHEPTSLLIVRGTREQLAVIHRVVGTLGDQAQTFADQKRAIQNAIGSLRIQIIEEESTMKVAQVRKRTSEIELARIVAGTPDTELHSRHQVEIARAEADIAVSVARIEHYSRMLADAGRRLAMFGD